MPQKHNPIFIESTFMKPNNLDEMLEVATKLSEGFIFIRVDLYAVGNKITFGELTFFSSAGLIKSTIERFNTEYAKLIQLPNL